jgi:hypothetical protein
MGDMAPLAGGEGDGGPGVHRGLHLAGVGGQARGQVDRQDRGAGPAQRLVQGGQALRDARAPADPQHGVDGQVVVPMGGLGQARLAASGLLGRAQPGLVGGAEDLADIDHPAVRAQLGGGEQTVSPVVAAADQQQHPLERDPLRGLLEGLIAQQHPDRGGRDGVRGGAHEVLARVSLEPGLLGGAHLIGGADGGHRSPSSQASPSGWVVPA